MAGNIFDGLGWLFDKVVEGFAGPDSFNGPVESKIRQYARCIAKGNDVDDLTQEGLLALWCMFTVTVTVARFVILRPEHCQGLKFIARLFTVRGWSPRIRYAVI